MPRALAELQVADLATAPAEPQVATDPEVSREDADLARLKRRMRERDDQNEADEAAKTPAQREAASGAGAQRK